MNAYYKETEKPYGYLLVDNKPGTPPDNQILADLFGECYADHFGVNSTEPTRVETKPVGKHSTTTKTTSSRKKPVQIITWSNATIPEWQKYTSGAPEVRKIPEDSRRICYHILRELDPKDMLSYPSGRFRKDMLSSKCTTHRVIQVISLSVEVLRSMAKIIGL